MSVADAIAAVVQSLVPQAEQNARLRDELVRRSQDIMNSHLGSSRQPGFQEAVDALSRRLNKNPAKAAKFSELATQFEDQILLSRKGACLTFLNSVESILQPIPSSSVTFQPLGDLSSLVSPPIVSGKKITNQPSHTLNPSRRSSKAELLRYHRSKCDKQQLPDRVLLRDCLYLMQGIAGKYVHFATEDEEKRIMFMEDNVHIVLQPTRNLIHRLSEIGHLYTRVAQFVHDVDRRQDVGMIEQSLCRHLQRQLTEYFRLVALLENHLLNSPTAGKPLPPDGITPRGSELTLHRLDTWIDDWRLRLRMMSVCVEACKDAQGGALVSLIHGYTDNGDPFIRHFTDSLLEDVSLPFFSTLQRWLFDGELRDPYSEFFVALNPDLLREESISQVLPSIESENHEGGNLGPSDIEGGRKLWQKKYIFRKEMLPSFVDEAFGKKIFSTGKSLNFIRYSCHDSDWIAARDEVSSAGRSLRYSDIPGLERSINAAYQVASQRLLNVFFEKFNLLDHLLALKHYLMLGYGDFADQLMEALGPNLSRPANALYRHNLTATLEAAIRSSNAQNDDPEVLRRLDARMLEYSHGEIGWDVFTLEYKVDAPIDTVLDPDSMLAYMKVFNHLWKLKRLEGTLGRGWMRIAGGARTFLKGTDLAPHWHNVRIVMAEMIHFIRQIQAWCQLDVIECSWKALMDFVNKKEGDLDAVIESHQVYLDCIVSKVLLKNPKVGKEEAVLSQELEIFQLILQFRDAVDNFYNATLAEAARQDTRMDNLRGVVTSTDLPSISSQDNLARVIKRVHDYGSMFSEKAQNLVHSLQSHADPDCRFLAIRLSFSDFYKSKSRVGL